MVFKKIKVERRANDVTVSKGPRSFQHLLCCEGGRTGRDEPHLLKHKSKHDNESEDVETCSSFASQMRLDETMKGDHD